jgi:hypothetical protein
MSCPAVRVWWCGLIATPIGDHAIALSGTFQAVADTVATTEPSTLILVTGATALLGTVKRRRSGGNEQ